MLLSRLTDRIDLNIQHLLSAGLMMAGLLLAWAVGNPTLGWQMRTALFFALLLALFFLLSSQTSLRLHLYAAILVLAFGWRTEQVAGVVVDAQQIFAWTLLLHLLIHRAAHPAGLRLRGFALGLVMGAAALWGYTIGISYGRSPLSMLNELGPFLFGIPIFIAIRSLVRTEADVEMLERVIAIAILLIAIPGVLEYGLSILFQRQFRPGSIVTTAEHFWRANYTFWGGTVAGYVLTPLVCMILPGLFSLKADRGWRFITSAALLFGVTGLYISGHRGAWLAFAVAILVFVLLSHRARIPLLLGLGVIWFLLPESAQRGLLSLLDPSLETGVYDTSAIGRYARMTWTLAVIRSHPWTGVGIAGTGWVHADLLQLAANLGLPVATLLVVAWFRPLGALLYRGLRAVWSFARDEAALDARSAALAAAGVASLVLLATQALIVISVLVMPVWITIGLLWAHHDLSSTSGTQ